MRKTPKISVIIISKNEEQKIRECLDSVKWADEIIVVDDISNDRTADICREYSKTRVFSHKMEGFGVQKNFALDKAEGEWVFSIDADERVSSELEKEIFEKIEKNEVDGYCLKRNNLIFGKWLLDTAAVNLRLFKRTEGVFTSKIVDETVILNGKTGQLENPLIHIPSSGKDIVSYIKTIVFKRSGYTARDLYAMGRRITLLNSWDYFLARPIFIFIQKFFQKKGYKYGFRGFLLAVFAAAAYEVSYLKLLGLQRKKGKKQ